MRGFLATAAPDVTVFSAAASGEASGSLDSFASAIAGSGFWACASATGFCVAGVPTLCPGTFVVGSGLKGF